MGEKRVLITGAGSGLGRALANRYAAAGYAVACADIVPERAEETVALLPGGGHFALAVDVGDDASVEALRDALLARWDTLDVVVNNAGVASGGGLLDSSMEEWRWMLEINLLGVLRGCRAFVPQFLRQRRGQVINIASFAGLAGAPNIMSYGVAKAGVVALSEQLRAELHPHGIGVSVVCPSFFQTRLCENFRGDPRIKDVAAKMMQSARESADDIAAAVFDAAARGTFLILPTRAERMRWRLKRWFPELYFRKLMEMATRRSSAPPRGAGR